MPGQGQWCWLLPTLPQHIHQRGGREQEQHRPNLGVGHRRRFLWAPFCLGLLGTLSRLQVLLLRRRRLLLLGGVVVPAPRVHIGNELRGCQRAFHLQRPQQLSRQAFHGHRRVVPPHRQETRTNTNTAAARGAPQSRRCRPLPQLCRRRGGLATSCVRLHFVPSLRRRRRRQRRRGVHLPGRACCATATAAAVGRRRKRR